MGLNESTERQKAFSEFEYLLGRENVLPEERACGVYGSATTGVARRILFALRPVSQEEVREIVRLSSLHKISLYTISTGKNWGYGSSTPTADEAVILDLSRLNTITDFDEELGTVTVGPGVTHQQLQEYLAEHALPFLAPATGAGGATSLIGNALEYGHGTGLHADRFSSLRGLSVILADGSTYASKTKGHSYSHARSTGPYLDGLFGQSNLGIVVEATFALAPKQERIELCVFPVKKDVPLGEIAEKIRSVTRELGCERISFSVQNKGRLLTKTASLKKSSTDTLSEWIVMGTIHGSRRLMPGLHKTLRYYFQDVSTIPLFFFTREGLQRLKKILPNWGAFCFYRALIPIAESHLRDASGESGINPSQLAYWKSRESGGNPDTKEHAGLLFYTATVPVKKTAVENTVSEVQRVCENNGFQSLLSFGLFSNHSLILTLPLLFDRKNVEEKERAYRCYRELAEIGEKRGFPLQRASSHAMEIVTRDSLSLNLTKRIKEALDPSDMLSSARYSPPIKEKRI